MYTVYGETAILDNPSSQYVHNSSHKLVRWIISVFKFMEGYLVVKSMDLKYSFTINHNKCDRFQLQYPAKYKI